jgi:N-acyl-D-amino-acid deacylase
LIFTADPKARLCIRKQLVAQAMEQGAFGLSTALQYVPDSFASTDEIIELAKVARSYGGVYFSHQRSESDSPARAEDGPLSKINAQAPIQFCP